MAITKTVYESSGKVVLENEQTGIMISTETYRDLTGMFGLNDEELFKALVI